MSTDNSTHVLRNLDVTVKTTLDNYMNNLLLRLDSNPLLKSRLITISQLIRRSWSHHRPYAVA